MSTLRLCSVSFLNARPLVEPLQELLLREPDREPLFSIEHALPSECARKLEAGECDVALVPVAAYAAHPEWEVVPGVAIAARGAVQTVVVASMQPLETLRVIHLDAASRTSVILLRLLLAERGLSPELVPCTHDEIVDRIRDDEGALVIGDAAFGVHRRFPHVVDLAAEWFTLTGLPMVFAFWAARPGVLTDAHVAALERARSKGILFAERYAEHYRDQLEREQPGAPLESIHVYTDHLRRSLRYNLGPYGREGLIEFLSRAHRAGLWRIPGLEAADTVHVAFRGATYEGLLH